jgi:DNA-binding transcriptional regulator GbsR (MarR family)
VGKRRSADTAATAFVEEFGMLMATEGLPRMAGRILGLLLVCEPPERTAAQLARELRASAGSISTMTRLLLRAELIERVSRPGVRADQFRVMPMTTLMRGASARMRHAREVMDRGLVALSGRPAATRARLESARDLYLLFEETVPALVDRFERQQAVRKLRDKRAVRVLTAGNARRTLDVSQA